MDRISSFVLAHRRWVFGFWLVMFVAGIAAAGAVPNRLSYDFALPGQQGYETEQKIIASYQGANAQAAYIPVVTVPQGQTITGSAASITYRNSGRISAGSVPSVAISASGTTAVRCVKINLSGQPYVTKSTCS